MNLKNPLIDLDHIKAEESLKQATLSHIYTTRKHRYQIPIIAVSLIACAAMFFWTMRIDRNPASNPSQSVAAYVSLDINPSMEIQLNEEQIVIHTQAYNEDGEALLAQVALQDLSLDEAMDVLLQNALFQSYMEEGYLQVSVFSDNTQHSIQIETQIEQTLAHHYDKDQYGCTCASSQDHKNASSHHMSFGRYQMIEDILALDDSYTIEQLQGTSMRELKELYEQLSMQKKQKIKQHHHQHKKDADFTARE